LPSAEGGVQTIPWRRLRTRFARLSLSRGLPEGLTGGVVGGNLKSRSTVDFAVQLRNQPADCESPLTFMGCCIARCRALGKKWRTGYPSTNSLWGSPSTGLSLTAGALSPCNRRRLIHWLSSMTRPDLSLVFRVGFTKLDAVRVYVDAFLGCSNMTNHPQ
jgi:hypothetical protein